MKKTQPETFTLDRIASPVGEVLLVTDAEGAVRAFDFVDYEARMRKLLARHYREVVLNEGRAPEAVRAAIAAYFSGDARALDGLMVKTGGTDPLHQRIGAHVGVTIAGEEHLDPGEYQEGGEDVEHPAVLTDQGRARANHDGPEHDHAEDAPEQHPVLKRARNGEVAEDHGDDEDIVHRQRLLDREAGQVLDAGLAAELPPDPAPEQ